MGYPTSQQKVDYLFKKIGFSASKTGVAEDQSGFTGNKKAPPNEAIPSPLVVPASSLWADTSYIPATPPTSSDGYVGVYKTTSSFRMTVDTTVSNNRTFIARDTWGNPASAIKGDWIDTQFGADYIIKVYKGDPSTSAATKILSAAGTSGKDDVWFFDYSSGVLNFNGEDLNGQLAGITTSNIYIVGYRYLGTKGVQPPAGIGTFNNLYVSGISTFVGLVDINGGGQANTFKVEDLTDNRIVIVGTGGELEDSANLTFDGTNFDITGSGEVSVNWKVTGISTFTGAIDANGDLDVDGRSELDNVNIAETLNVVGVSTFNEDVNFIGAAHNAQWDKSANSLKFAGNAHAVFGSTNLLELRGDWNTGSSILNSSGTLYLDSVGNVRLRTGTNKNALNAIAGGAVELYYGSTPDKRIETTEYGALFYGGQAGIGTIAGPATFHIDPATVGDDTGTVVIKGNLQVDGTQTTVNSATMTVTDKNIEIAKGAANDAAADGAGITVDSGDGDKTLNWVDATDAWTSSEHIQVAAGKRLGFADDTNTYVDRPAVDRIRFTTGGSERLIVTNDGINVTGISTFSSNIDANGDLDVDGRAELDNVNIAETLNVVGVSTFTGAIDANGDLDVDGRSELDNVNIAETLNVVGLSTFNANVHLLDNDRLRIGGSAGTFDGLELYHDGSHSYINDSGTGELKINGSGIEILSAADTVRIGSVLAYETQIFHSNSEKLASKVWGINVTGTLDTDQLKVSGISTFTGNIDANGDLDVDGRAELDNVNIAETLNVVGVSTFTGNIDANGDLDVDGRSELDNVNIAETLNVVGVSTFTAVSNFDNAITVDGSVGIADSIIHLGNTDTSIRFPADDTFAVEIAGTERFKVESNGYVSIPWDSSSQYTLLRVGDISGTSEPQIQLYTDSSANTAVVNSRNNHDLTLRTNNTEKVRITKEGKVGVGTIATASIAAKLHVVEPTEGSSVIQLNSGDGYPGVNRNLTIKSGTGGWAGAKWIFDAVSSGGQLEFQTTSIKRLHILHSGYVGIGSGTPSAWLDVNANSAATIQLKNTGTVNSMLMYIGSSTNSIYSRGANSSTARDFTFLQGNTEKLRIRASGDIHIVNNVNVVGVSTFNDNVKLLDADVLSLGTGQDLQLSHANDISLIRDTRAGVGGTLAIGADHLILRNKDGNEKYLEATDNGSVKLYHDFLPKFETISTGATVTGTVYSNQLNVSGVSTFTGSVDINNNVDISGWMNVNGNIDADGDLDVDGRSELDNVNIAETLNVSGITTFNVNTNFIGGGAGITSAYWDQSAASLKFKDNVKAQFGDGLDLSIYASGTDKYIKGSTSGELIIRDDAITMQAVSSTDTYFDAIHGGSVSLFWDNAKRLETTGTGVNITDDLNVAGVSTFVGETNIGTGGTVFTALVGAAASVGIGSALPDYMLDVAGAINSETDIKVQGVSVSDTALNDAVAMAIALG